MPKIRTWNSLTELVEYFRKRGASFYTTDQKKIDLNCEEPCEGDLVWVESGDYVISYTGDYEYYVKPHDNEEE